MVRLAVVVFAGCGFSASARTAPETDAPQVAPADGATEPTTTVACRLRAMGSSTDAAALGGSGGTQRADVTCAVDEFPIGVGFDRSQNGIANHANQYAMVNLRVRCGRVDRQAGGSLVTTPTSQVVRLGGDGNCGAYAPTVVAPEAVCPTGSVLVGMRGNRLDSTLYNTVSLECAQIAGDGSITAATTLVPVANTGAYMNQPQMSTCGAGQVVASFGVRSGCGHDQLLPRCRPAACE